MSKLEQMKKSKWYKVTTNEKTKIFNIVLSKEYKTKSEGVQMNTKGIIINLKGLEKMVKDGWVEKVLESNEKVEQLKIIEPIIEPKVVKSWEPQDLEGNLEVERQINEYEQKKIEREQSKEIEKEKDIERQIKEYEIKKIENDKKKIEKERMVKIANRFKNRETLQERKKRMKKDNPFTYNDKWKKYYKKLAREQKAKEIEMSRLDQEKAM